MPRVKLSLSEARRAALAAQGFDRKRPVKPNRGHVRRTIDLLGLLQLDFVNVLVPAHYLVMYSRLGHYDRSLLDSVVYGTSDFIEHWAHEASIVPAELWPALEYRRQDYKPWPNSSIMQVRGRTKYLQEILETVKMQGPLTASDLPAVAAPKRKPGDWHKSVPRSALEVHFGRGDVTVADRLPNFQRAYDVPERQIAACHLETRLNREDSQRQLLARAARAHGVATLHDLADYYRMSPRDASPRIRELVESGDVIQVAVEGWDEVAYLHRDARIPRRVGACSLLSPFDPVVWFRPRGERLFDFLYRIEIYVPAAKRRWGYYVLPFLLDDEVVARVDLKADRKAGELLVLASHCEARAAPDRVCAALSEELQTLAGWLGLDRVRVGRKGGLARELRRHCR